MILKPIELEHGERYGKLTVLRKIKLKNRGPKYACGCACGYAPIFASAGQLMRGIISSCMKCRSGK